MLALMLFGCSSPSEEDSSDPSTTTATPTTATADSSGYGSWEGEEITVAVLAGAPLEAFQLAGPEFEEMTGLKVNLVEVPFGELYSRFMTEARSRSGAFDLLMSNNTMVADFVGFIEPLDPYIEQWPLDDPEDIVESFRHLSRLDGSTYCLTIDGDALSLYYRQSYFDDPDSQEAFEADYGRELAVPETWEEFNEVAEFFAQQNGAGTALMLSRVQMPFEFAQRYYSQGGQWFDPETMEPQINGPAGVATVEAMIETIRHSPSGVLGYGFTETLDDFVQGRIPMIVQWPDAGIVSGDPERAAADVVGDVGYAPVPGTIINGELHQPQSLAWGNCLQMSRDSENKEAAYQFARYFTSADVSGRTVPMGVGLDPYRYSHIENSDLRQQFEGADEWLDQHLATTEEGIPDLRIPGAQRYYDLIAEHLGQAFVQNQDDLEALDVQKVLDGLAEDWEALTDSLGRDAQLDAYNGRMRSVPGYEALGS